MMAGSWQLSADKAKTENKLSFGILLTSIEDLLSMQNNPVISMWCLFISHLVIQRDLYHVERRTLDSGESGTTRQSEDQQLF